MFSRFSTIFVAISLGVALAAPAWAQAPPKEPADRPDATAAEAADDESASASGTTLDASLEQDFEAPETPRVGDDLVLMLTVEHPTNATVTLPDSYGTARWELEDAQRSTTSAEDESTKTTLTLTFQVFRTGATTLPSFPITLLDDRGRTQLLETDAVETKILSVLDPEEEAEFLPARPPVPLWVEDYTLAWVGGVLAAAVLAGLIVFLLMRRREQDAYVEPSRPAHVVALEKLSALSPGDLLERGNYMIFYVRMSEAVREYLGRRYGFRGTELTTTEIQDHLEEVEWPEGLSFEEVRSWMQHCDLIKFSGQVPDRSDAEDALRRAFAIVELTRPPKEPDDGEEQEDPASEAQRASQDPDDYEPEPRSPYAPAEDDDLEDTDETGVADETADVEETEEVGKRNEDDDVEEAV